MKATPKEMKKCKVCNTWKSAKSVANNYGVQSCSGCKTFFRSVCRGQKKCEPCTSHYDNCKCDQCRFKKCLAKGMSETFLRADNKVGGRTILDPVKSKRSKETEINEYHSGGKSSLSPTPKKRRMISTDVASSVSSINTGKDMNIVHPNASNHIQVTDDRNKHNNELIEDHHVIDNVKELILTNINVSKKAKAEVEVEKHKTNLKSLQDKIDEHDHRLKERAKELNNLCDAIEEKKLLKLSYEKESNKAEAEVEQHKTNLKSLQDKIDEHDHRLKEKAKELNNLCDAIEEKKLLKLSYKKESNKAEEGVEQQRMNKEQSFTIQIILINSLLTILCLCAEDFNHVSKFNK